MAGDFLDRRVEAEDLIKIADRLMYDIKHNGKDAIAYALHAPAAQPQEVGKSAAASAAALQAGS